MLRQRLPSNDGDRASALKSSAFADLSMSLAEEHTTSPPTSPASQQTTPTQPAPQIPLPVDVDPSPSSPSPTVALSKSHSRNLSLTNATYIEFYQKQQQNRLSVVMGDGIVRRGSREGSPNSTIGGLRGNNHSALSLAGTGSLGSLDSLSQTASSQGQQGLLPIPPAMGAQESTVTSSSTPSYQL